LTEDMDQVAKKVQIK